MFHDDAVLAGERHHIGHSADGDQLQERFQHAPQLRGRPVHLSQERLHQLERHADAAKILFRIVAIRTVGIQHGNGWRQLGLRQVVVCDDDVD